MWYIKKVLLIIIVLIGGIFLLAFAPCRTENTPIPPKVLQNTKPETFVLPHIRLVAVLAQNACFEDTWITTKGILCAENGGLALYFTPEDQLYGISENAVWIGSLSERYSTDRDMKDPRLYLKDALLNGFVDYMDKGPNGAYAATIWEVGND